MTSLKTLLTASTRHFKCVCPSSGVKSTWRRYSATQHKTVMMEGRLSVVLAMAVRHTVTTWFHALTACQKLVTRCWRLEVDVSGTSSSLLQTWTLPTRRRQWDVVVVAQTSTLEREVDVCIQSNFVTNGLPYGREDYHMERKVKPHLLYFAP